MDSELPTYADAHSSPPPHSAPGSSSNSANAGSQHTVSLQDSKGVKWLNLTVNSRAPDPASPPIFYEGDTISGKIDVEFLKSETVKAVSIKITAGTTFVGQEEQLFINSETDIWTPSMSLPDGSKIAKFNKGKYTWPFSLTLPTEAEVQDYKTKTKFPLPSSFSERAATAYLDYKLVVTIKRGLLKVNQTLFTSFAYVPITRPELPSPMLQKACKENLPFVGPEGDPDGWHVIPPVTITGEVFTSRNAEVTLSLALAKPLTYARGTAMPLWLTLTGSDEHALDLLASPKAIKLLMVRSLATALDATRDDIEHRTDNCFYENVARAVFWAPDDASGPGKRVLQGEIGVKKSLKLSTLFPRFTLRYHLELQPFEAPGFVVTTPKTSPILRQKVDVVTLPAPGVALRSHAPPEYIQEQAVDYNKSIGVLENGNQRFVHHAGAAGF